MRRCGEGPVLSGIDPEHEVRHDDSATLRPGGPLPVKAWREGRFRHARAAALLVCATALLGAVTAEATTVVLLRHAEKQEGENPRLTEEGQRRAVALSQVVKDAGVDAIYATEWCRTALTAEPVAELLDADLRIQDNGRPGDQLADCGLVRAPVRLDPSIATVEDLARHLVTEHRDGVVLVVGHSNTVPALIEALGGPGLCPQYFPADDRDCHIPDEAPNSEYDHLFVLDVSPEGRARLVKAQYGD
jgi:phosphohistidine phosphatase SixA